MNRDDFRHLSKLRAIEGKCLLDAGLYAGSYYLTGYSVECALKAVIAGHRGRYEFPDKGLTLACHTHDLARLVTLAGLQSDLDDALDGSAAFRENWNTVKRWNEVARYKGTVSARQAHCLYIACAGHPIGVIPWIEAYW